MAEQKSAPNGAASAPMKVPIDRMQENVFGKLQPYMESVVDFCSQLGPEIEIFKKIGVSTWGKIEPYYSQYWKEEVTQVFIGLVLLFFGAKYSMTIACFMAIQISGLETMKKSWKIIKTNYNNGMEAFRNDENAQKFFDINGDGRISFSEVAQAFKILVIGTIQQKKSILLNLRCVFVAIDPRQVMKGVGGFWATVIAVIATLQSAFVRDVALGISISEIVSKQFGKYVKPMIEKRFDDDMKKWVDCLIYSLCRLCGIILALTLFGVVSAFHSAIKGGHMIAKLYTGNPQKNVGFNTEGTTDFMAVQYGLAAVGFLWQLYSGFAINYSLMTLILFPVSFIEVILRYLAIY